MSKGKQQNDLLIFEFIKDRNYRIRKDGTVMTLVQRNGQVGRTWRQAGTLHTDGYMRVRYQGARLRIHRIVWARFHGYLKSDLVINHIDGNKTNNAIENLEIVTQSANRIHAYRVLGHNPNRGNAKVTWQQVDAIRKDRAEGMTLDKLKEKYTVSKTALSYICSGKTYREELRNAN